MCKEVLVKTLVLVKFFRADHHTGSRCPEDGAYVVILSLILFQVIEHPSSAEGVSQRIDKTSARSGVFEKMPLPVRQNFRLHGGHFGASLGVVWRINPWLTAGASYRSKNHNGKHKDYRGLIAGGGRLELPAIYGGGLSIRASPSVTIALEAQRYTYRSSDAFGNGLDRLAAVPRMG